MRRNERRLLQAEHALDAGRSRHHKRRPAVVNLFAVGGAHEMVGLVNVPEGGVSQGVSLDTRTPARAAAADATHCSLAIMDQGQRSTGLALSECFNGGPSSSGSPAASCPVPAFQCV
jgi:hypothetical protein